MEESSKYDSLDGSKGQVLEKSPPAEAGEWNGTTVTMTATNINQSVVRYVRFASLANQMCTSEYFTEGTINQPWTIGWVAMTRVGNFSQISHEFVQAGTISGELAGNDVSANEEYPQYAYGHSFTQIRVQPGHVLEYYFVASYPSESPDGKGGFMELEINCPEGLRELETGWSTDAHLLSEISMEGTWARTEVFFNTHIARWSAQVDARWSAKLPEREFTFISKEPPAGFVTLTSSDEDYTCGPSTDPDAVEGRVLCVHEFGGGETEIQVDQVSIGSIGQSGTYDSWMAMIAQIDYYSWSDPYE